MITMAEAREFIKLVGDLLIPGMTIYIIWIGRNVRMLEKNTNSISVRNEAIARELGIHDGAKRQKEAGEEKARALEQGREQGASETAAGIARVAIDIKDRTEVER